MTFNDLPNAVEQLLAMVTALQKEIKEMREGMPANEPPIDGKELRNRLGISFPTEMRMRKKGNLPFFMVNGSYRYLWQDVQRALSDPKYKPKPPSIKMNRYEE